MSKQNIQLELTRDEALVLFEWLARTDAAEVLPIEDAAERHVLWKLEGKLESLLDEPLAENYKSLLAEARRKVRDSGG